MAATGELASGKNIDADDMPRDAVLEVLSAADIEIYRDSEDEVHLAERVRMHLMDSGVSVRLGRPTSVVFAIRCQRSDFPADSEDRMYQRVRDAVGAAASEAGFRELRTRPRRVTDPMDEENVLDVWYEVSFARAVASLDELREAACWALARPKCVG